MIIYPPVRFPTDTNLTPFELIVCLVIGLIVGAIIYYLTERTK